MIINGAAVKVAVAWNNRSETAMATATAVHYRHSSTNDCWICGGNLLNQINPETMATTTTTCPSQEAARHTHVPKQNTEAPQFSSSPHYGTS